MEQEVKTKKSVDTSAIKETAAKVIFTICAAFSIFAVFAIVFYILWQSIPAFREIGVLNFLFGTTWAPSHEEIPAGERFGILPMIVSSIAVTFGAVLIGGLFGIFTAVFMTYYCPKKVKGVYSQVINLLAGIPSIVYGFFGLAVLLPALRSLFNVSSSNGVLVCSLILGLMILPTIASLTKNSLQAVPESYYEGSLALGNTKHQTVFKVCLPAAKRGIIAALILGVGRAVGETMAVLMIAGNATNFPTGLFENIRTLTINIVMEMGYSTGLHTQALIATGFILLIFILILNLCLGALNKTSDKKRGSLFNKKLKEKEGTPSGNYVYRSTGFVAFLLMILSAVIACIVFVVLAYLIVFIFIKGIPYMSVDLLFGESGNAHSTLAPAFKSTGMLILLPLLIALPLGIGAAIFLNEYSKKGSKFVRIVRLFIDTLSGIPSIIFGLFGQILFVSAFGYSLLSGSLTLVLIILPTIIRSTEQSLSEIPDSMREGSLALGASKVRTIFKVVMPSAISGIVTAIILSIGRIVGESAALIFTSGAVPYMPDSYLSQGSSFAVMMYRFYTEGLEMGNMYATAVVLIVIVIIINALVTLCEKKLRKKL